MVALCEVYHEGHYIHSGAAYWLQMILNVPTNFFLLPGVLLTWKLELPIDAIIGMSALSCSSVYHILQAGGGEILGASEYRWHVVDNLFAAICLAGTPIMAFQHPFPPYECLFKYLAVIISALAIYLSPMSKVHLATAIAWPYVVVLGHRLRSRTWPHTDTAWWLVAALVSIVLSVLFFWLGLSATRDPNRAAHGFWHITVAAFHFSLTKYLNPPCVVEVRRAGWKILRGESQKEDEIIV
ncbi:MAG: hypothetical protein KVP17_004183 [Porospora cf. gigantea B]|uniref:uncharacterized protein n=1 Tax=Porospora cf. gigantea B TaxID=2853592 RepID=UPI003571B406|nr:MAG: hypothetical protein KVP17_004183 [Porospora cf. gigantea B]